jgi:hypothetical protein
VRRVFVLVAVVAMLTAMTGSALASTVYNVIIPLTTGRGLGTEITNPCNGHLIALTGFEHDQFTVTTNQNGGVHVDIRSNLMGVTGVDEVTGATYRVVLTSTTQEADSTGVPFVLSVPTDIEFIGQGTAPNFLAHFLNHVTVNPDGTITAETFKSSTECK